jgi:hypothetical protein
MLDMRESLTNSSSAWLAGWYMGTLYSLQSLTQGSDSSAMLTPEGVAFGAASYRIASIMIIALTVDGWVGLLVLSFCLVTGAPHHLHQPRCSSG